MIVFDKKFPSNIKKERKPRHHRHHCYIRSCYNIIFGQCKNFFSISFHRHHHHPLTFVVKATTNVFCIFLHNLDHPDFERERSIFTRKLLRKRKNVKKKRVVRWKFMRITRTSPFFCVRLCYLICLTFPLFRTFSNH